MMTGSILHNLEPESALLLYLADELPADDRAEVERRLAEQPQWRETLERLAAMESSIQSVLDEADRLSVRGNGAAQAAGVRRAVRAMNQWHVDRLAGQNPAGQQRSGPRMGWMTYSIGTAAILLVTLFVWWSRVDDSKLYQNQTAEGGMSDWQRMGGYELPPDEYRARLIDTLSYEPLEPSRSLSEVEDRISAIAYLAESVREQEVTQ